MVSRAVPTLRGAASCAQPGLGARPLDGPSGAPQAQPCRGGSRLAAGREAPAPAPSQLGDQPLLLGQPLLLVLAETQAQRLQKGKD